jgi:uncharacterized membrane protein
MATNHEDRTVGDTMREVTRDISELIREEMALAKTELRQGFRQVARGVVFLLAAAFIVNAGFLALVASLVLGLTGAVAAWLSAFLVGAVLAIIGVVLLMKGVGYVREADLKPERTIETLKQDARIVKERGNE